MLTLGKGADNLERFRRHESVPSIVLRVVFVNQSRCGTRADLGFLPHVVVKGPRGQTKSYEETGNEKSYKALFVLAHHTPIALIETYHRICNAPFQAPRTANNLSREFPPSFEPRVTDHNAFFLVSAVLCMERAFPTAFATFRNHSPHICINSRTCYPRISIGSPGRDPCI